MLEYIKVGKEVIFLRDIPEGVTVNVSRVRTPKWRSLKGFYGWAETISSHLGISRAYARALLMSNCDEIVIAHKDDEEWIRDYADQTPFDHDFMKPDEFNEWYTNFRFMNGDNYQAYLPFKNYFRPKNIREFQLAYFVWYAEGDWTEEVYIERMQTFVRLQGYKYWSMEQALVFGKLGKLEPKFRAMHKKNSTMCIEAARLGVLEYLNIDYMPTEGSSSSVSALVKAGVRLHQLLPELTKKERHIYLTQYGKMEVILHYMIRARYPDMPDAWIQYLDSMLQADWAWRKRNQLSKSREIYGPGGETATFHYHQLLQEVTDDMLVNGPKTSWRSVVGILEMVVQTRIEAQLGNNVSLPIIHKGKGDIKAIDTSHGLRDEGKIMNHCVGGYINSCLDGSSYIFHIGETAPNGATFEVIVKDNEYHMQQIFAAHDKKAPADLRIRAEKFVVDLNKESHT